MPTVEDLMDASGNVVGWKVYWNISRAALPAGVDRKKTSRTFSDEAIKNLVVDAAREAKHRLTVDQVLDVIAERNPTTTSSVMTFRQFTEETFLPHQRWLRKNKHENERRITKVIVPALGDYPLDEVTPQVIDDFLTTLKTTRTVPRTSRLISFATVDDYFDNLAQIIRFAHADGVITVNPLLRVRWEKNQSDSFNVEDEENSDLFFQPYQIELLLGHLREDFRPFAQFMLETGARFSESTALQVKHIRADGWVNIRQAWEGEYAGLKDDIRIKRPKKDRDRPGRWVKITDHLLAALNEMNKDKSQKDFVFVSSHGARIRNQNFVRDHWKPAMTRFQQCPDHLPTRIDGRSKRPVLDRTKPSSCSCLGDLAWTSYTPHTLRHTFATWAIDSGVDIRDVAYGLGHKSVTTTERIYTHQIARSRGGHVALLIDSKRLRMPDMTAKRPT